MGEEGRAATVALRTDRGFAGMVVTWRPQALRQEDRLCSLNNSTGPQWQSPPAAWVLDLMMWWTL